MMREIVARGLGGGVTPPPGEQLRTMRGLTLLGLALLRALLTALLVLAAARMLLAALLLLAVLVELDRLAGLFLVALVLHAIAPLIHLALIALLLVMFALVHCYTCSSPEV